jgi:hypothetical protein
VYSHKPFYIETAAEVDEEEEGYLVDHSIAIYLLSPANVFLEYYPRRVESSAMMEKIEVFMHEWDMQQHLHPHVTQEEYDSDEDDFRGPVTATAATAATAGAPSTATKLIVIPSVESTKKKNTV